MSNTKENIMKTAFNLFLAKSYKEVTLNNILEKTGLSKGAFYHYFRSKEELFINCVEQYYFNLVSFDDKTIPQDNLSDFYHHYAELVQNGFTRLKKSLEDNDPDDDANYLSIALDAMHRFPGFKDLYDKQQKQELDLWLKVIQNARKTGEINTMLNDTHIAEIFIHTSDGIGIKLILSGKVDSLKQSLISLWDSFYLTLRV